MTLKLDIKEDKVEAIRRFIPSDITWKMKSQKETVDGLSDYLISPIEGDETNCHFTFSKQFLGVAISGILKTYERTDTLYLVNTVLEDERNNIHRLCPNYTTDSNSDMYVEFMQEYDDLVNRIIFTFGLALYILVPGMDLFVAYPHLESEVNENELFSFGINDKWHILSQLDEGTCPVSQHTLEYFDDELSRLIGYLWFNLPVDFTGWDAELMRGTLELAENFKELSGLESY